MRKIASILTMCMILTVPLLIFSSKVSVANASNGAISLSFDDCLISQYDYAYPIMRARGVHGTFYIVSDWVGVSGEMSASQLLTLQNDGDEIGSHSKTHPDFTQLSEQQIRSECELSKEKLESYGFNIENFAYPYSSDDGWVDSVVQQYYRSGRLCWGGLDSLPYSAFQVSGFEADGLSGGKLAAMEAEVDNICRTQAWVVFCFHDITPTDGGSYHISQNDFANFLDYAIQKGVAIMTVHEALSDSPPTPPETPPETPPQTPVPPSQVSVGITLSPSSLTMQYTFDYGASWTAPEKIVRGTRTYSFVKWDDGWTDLTRTFTEDAQYKIIYS